MNSINFEIYKNLESLLPFDNQGWNGNSQIFKNLIQTVNPKIIIEVGSWKGQSAITMGKTVKELQLDTKIYCVDTWLGALEFWDNMKSTPERNLLLKNGYPQIYYQFLSNIIHSGLQDIILPFPNTSLIGARYFKNNNIKADLIYIDASHDEEDVYLDLKYYFPLLNNKGIIFGDDYNSWKGVKLAVDKFTHEINSKIHISENNYWIIQK